ncbi:hypothetical protein ACLB2K_031424 [Fragaria x ananassa]
MTEIETRISTGDADPHFFLCGRLIGMNKPVVTPILSSVLSGAWNLKEKLLAREEESAENDRLSPMEDDSLNHLEVWISIAGLRFAMRNNMVLSCVANGLGVFVRVDPGLIQRKEKIQRVRVVLDVRNRIPAKHIFDYSPELAVKLEFKVERAHGICKDCGFFGHGRGICDKGLICGLPVELALQVEEAAPTGLEDRLSGSEEAAVCGPLKVGPGDSRRKRKLGFGTEADGFRFSGYGPAGTDLVLKKPKSSFHSGELVEVPVWFGSISRKKSPKKRGRPRGSRNKKRTSNGDPKLSDSMAPNSKGASAEIGLESKAGEE